MDGNGMEPRETSCRPHSFRKMRRIGEIMIEDSPKPSPLSKTEGNFREDSCSNFLMNVKIKQGPSSKLSQLKKALELNKQISSCLEGEIQRVKLAYEINLEKQAVLQKIVDQEKEMLKANYKPPSEIKAISVFAAPYFRDVRGMVPPSNEDTKIKTRNRDINAYFKPPRPWTKEENKNLLDGVTAYSLLSALKPYKIKRDHLKKKLKDQDLPKCEVKKIEKQIVSVEKKINSISKKPLTKLLKEVEGKIDWMNVSAVNMEGTKTPDECENMWNNYLSFSVNKEVFTFEEDERLKKIVDDNNGRDWDKVAKLLKSNRTAIQCFERYQTRLSTVRQKRFWTPEEDKKVLMLVKKYRSGKIIPWNKISSLMEGRTRQQIINRYERSLGQKGHRGPWTPEEDALLIACNLKYASRWCKMKDLFPRRSACAIRERFVNTLDPSIKMGCWSKNEDKLLITLIQRHGYGRWAKICKHIPGRTDNMCLVRAGRLLEHSFKYHSEKGTGDYDPDVHDPELFAKILLPVAPSKDISQNKKVKSCREDALEVLMIALRKVKPEIQLDEEDFDSNDFSWLTHELLKRISEELHCMLEQRMNRLEPHVRSFTKPPLSRKRPNEDSEDSITQPSPEKCLSQEDRMWLSSVMNSLLEMDSKIMSPGMKNLKQKFSKKDLAEMAWYKAYLEKEFKCNAVCDEEDDIEHMTSKDRNFSNSLHTVVSHFVQPPVYDGQFIVTAPNVTTLGAMEVIEVTEDRLWSMSKYIGHSTKYLDFLCNRRKSSPKCLQCLYNQKLESTPSRCVDDVVHRMKKDLFIVDDTLREAINVECSLLTTSNGTCCCAQLEESKKSVDLLRKRFMSLFLWPALLSTIDLTKEQNDILCAKRKHSNV